jgi:murein L,D-transpeptidase YcbB/YkuD
VNIPAATYRLVEDGQPVFENVTIVGQPDWPTPEVDSQIERIEFNPFWTVPPRIARLELLPKIRQDPEYLARHNMRQVAGMYRQDPGADNALGRVKFLFPNPHAVYLHDTNSPRLFQRQARYLSHGCVRVSNALDLAERLLEDEANWSREEIAEVLRRGKNRQATLSQPMPIHLVYDTAWVDDAGTVNFRDDIYGRDGTAAGAG